MSLGAGTRLGPYEILSALGAAGMGEIMETKEALSVLCALCGYVRLCGSVFVASNRLASSMASSSVLTSPSSCRSYTCFKMAPT